MTAAEHQARHRRLSEALDELVACYIQHEGVRYVTERRSGVLSGTSLLEFIIWSARMCTAAGETTGGTAPRTDESA